MPGSIVGAIANEGGLSSAQIGGIDIRADHTLVELPADLSQDQLRALSRTRIGGELIHLELDNGRKPARERESGGFNDRGDRGGFKKDFKKRDGERSFGDRSGSDRGGFKKREGDRGGFKPAGTRAPRFRD